MPKKFDFFKKIWYNIIIMNWRLNKLIKLDYTLDSAEERIALVKKFLEENPDPGERYLEVLSDYIILQAAKEEKKEKKENSVITDNRMVTINKRETSLEGLVSQFENGEDGVYNLITNDKNIIFKPKNTITKKDLEEIPPLRQVREAIETWGNVLKTAQGKDAYIAKSAMIELRKDQYVIKDAYKKPVNTMSYIHSKAPIKLDGEITIDAEGTCHSTGIVFTDSAVIEAILCNYSSLKQNSYGVFENDTWYLMQDFDDLSERALEDYPLYQRIVELKIDGKQNLEIQAALEEEFGIKHSVEYISSLWRNKIPELIAAKAEEEALIWHYFHKDGVKPRLKTCTRCGQTKLAHNKFFSKNKSSKDGFYSICKQCRNKKK